MVDATPPRTRKRWGDRHESRLGKGMMDGAAGVTATPLSEIASGGTDRPARSDDGDRPMALSDGSKLRATSPPSTTHGSRRQRIPWSGHADFAVNGIICALVRHTQRRQRG